jgi:hypothetical protein
MTTSPPRFTLHVADRADLPRLGRTLNNSRATYGRRRTGGRDRIVEVRDRGRTRYAVHVHDGRVVMFEAADNRPPDARDVPVVRRLLEDAGVLAATRTPAGISVQQLAAELPAATRPPAGISVQQLAAELLAPQVLGGVEWPEVAAALWRTGWLPRLPDPTETVYAQIVRDLAQRVTTGAPASPRAAPTDTEFTAARQRLLAAGRDHNWAAWQRQRMAELLGGALRP